MNILNEIKNTGIIPVVCINDAKKAVPLAEALRKGGINSAEVTFRTDSAEEAIKEMCKAFPDMLIGAGTVLNIAQAQRAKNAGAKFIVSPGFNPKVVSWCLENNILPLPGCTTPSEIEQAIEMGLETVKFFPAEQSGGLAKIKALSAPYTKMTFMPTGGIGLKNMNEYLAFSKIIACGGSFMVKGELLDNDEWDTITALTREAVDTMLSLKLDHIGINSANENEAKNLALMFTNMFGWSIGKETEAGIFAGNIEVMKSDNGSRKGHIAVSTNSVERAIYYLSKRGVKFKEDSAMTKPDGSKFFIYIDADFGGFDIHLIEK